MHIYIYMIHYCTYIIYNHLIIYVYLCYFLFTLYFLHVNFFRFFALLSTTTLVGLVKIRRVGKDFVIDEYQVDEALAHGADTVLLMVPWGETKNQRKKYGLGMVGLYGGVYIYIHIYLWRDTYIDCKYIYICIICTCT